VENEALPEVEQSTAVSEAETPEVAEAEKPEAAPEKTESELRMEQLERENKKLLRGIDRKTKQVYEARARNGLTNQSIGNDNRGAGDDSDTVTLTRAELEQRDREVATRLGPALAKEAQEAAKYHKAAKSLADAVGGQEKFQELTDELAEGIKFSAAKQIAVLDSDTPAALLQYLTDPENADEAEEIAALSDIQAGRRLARIESKLAKQAEESAANSKPEPSKAPKPLEPVRGVVTKVNGMPDPKNTRAWMDWRNAQEAKGLA
jgi:hypothetical protein